MIHPRIALALLALVPAVAGCGAPTAPAEPVPAARYAPRTDLLVIAIPEGAPTHWPAAGFPPPRSARLFPNTPDRDLAAELRKQLGKNVLDPTDVSVLSPGQAEQIARLVDAHFGTPAVPVVRVPNWDTVVANATIRLNPEKTFGGNLKGVKERLASFKWDTWKADREAANAAKAELKLDDDTLARGAIVYRRWCMQCHGPSGAGEPAQAVEGGPAPRDYRQGAFKYVTAFPPNLPKKGLGAAGKARRDDLKRTVRNGIDGTIMPAFTDLTEQELDDAVSYVIHLSVRGETEFATLAKITNVNKLTENDPDFVGGELDWLFVQNELWVLLNWGVAARNPIPVPPEPFATGPERLKSAVRGYKLYNASEFGCAACHANYGRVQQLKWDAWGTVVQPRNLTLGVYRGGRRGEDLYARLYGGIYPAGMTAFHDRIANTPPGTPNKLWDIVHFLQALGDPADRKRMQQLDSEVKLEP
jgi:mono/diheme cytochrome c family protein